MLVDINLLPKKEKKNYSQILFLILFIIIIVIGAILFFLKYQFVTSEIEEKDAILIDIEISIETVQQKQLTKETGNTALQLQKAIDWVEDVPIPTVFFMDHIVSLLPERGFFLNYNYSDTGNVSLNVQFDTKLQVSYYLKELKQSEYIKQVTLTNISASFKEGTEGSMLTKESYVPRYLANFELELDTEKLRDSAMKEEKDNDPSNE
ncbi:hypothetical protein [Bacillus solimangrovi]|uniref:Fimbrial assembly protein n=1 Tax=Bacillus solimangrovi TaxID=1305675 RepID=A0A1E5LBJ3_9BACI|nr:hypothetical protein [Bacillus solimangrovi]OEH91458.1 hypothetical protein BFG57_04910 [Bacillus solimangrovi]